MAVFTSSNTTVEQVLKSPALFPAPSTSLINLIMYQNSLIPPSDLPQCQSCDLCMVFSEILPLTDMLCGCEFGKTENGSCRAGNTISLCLNEDIHNVHPVISRLPTSKAEIS